MIQSVKKVIFVLIKPSQYDDNGYVIRFKKGGMTPSPTLGVINAMTHQVAKEILLPNSYEIHVIQDEIKDLARQHDQLLANLPSPGTKVIVCLVGVQSSQFRRACDLISKWQAVDATCIIGGIHVTGTINALGRLQPEVEQLQKKGVIIFHGEAHTVYSQAITDILKDQTRPIYKGGQPNLDLTPPPLFPPGFTKQFVGTMQSLHTSDGCPYNCRFCSVTTCKGQVVNSKNPDLVIAEVESMVTRNGQANFFLIDDNFSRNKYWREICRRLTSLRQKGHKIHFMIQADEPCCSGTLASHKDFVEVLARAGCRQIFIGIESLNPQDLADQSKKQNKVDRYRSTFTKIIEAGIIPNPSMMIGFPNDTKESIRQMPQRLREMGAKLIYFYILTPCPGSQYHASFLQQPSAGENMLDSDLNQYDSAHVVTASQCKDLSNVELVNSYWDCWRQAYNIKAVMEYLSDITDKKIRLRLLLIYFFIRRSVIVYRTPPMMAGSKRIRSYRDRRPGSTPISKWQHLISELTRHMRETGLLLAEFYLLMQVYTESEIVRELKTRGLPVTNRINGIGDWFKRTFGKFMHRRWLNDFWFRYARHRWQLLFNPVAWRWHIYMLPHAFTEVVYTIRFAIMLRRMICSR